MLNRIERVLYQAYRLALMLGVLAVVLTPLHRAHTRHADLLHTGGDVVEVGAEPDGLALGDRVRVFRFNPGWTEPIGFVEVTALRPDGFSARPVGRYQWPLGVQGSVVESTGPDVVVDIGERDGVSPRANLSVFVERERVGRVRVIESGPNGARARRISGTVPVGAAVSSFTVATQVAWFTSPGVVALEWAALAATLCLWAWGVFSPQPGRWLAALRAGLVRLWRTGGAPLRLVTHAVLGVIIVPVVVWFSWGALLHVLQAGAGHWTTWVSRVDLRAPLVPWTSTAHQLGIVILGSAWALLLIRTTRSPAVALWRAVGFTPRLEGLPPAVRGLGVWLLHGLVFYAFGSTLTGFLQGNVSGLLRIGWAREGMVGSIADLPMAMVYMVTHTPSIGSWDEAAHAARLALWSVTICGCLVGYGHTVVSILWKRSPIKNIDFTPVGWMVNAMCYGPLLGGVVYRLHGSPPPVLDPSLAGGPAWAVQLAAEFLLNLLYTLSIWNLGTRFGVMVDKGVEDRGFYSFVRHPSYTLESLMFVTLGLTACAAPMHYALALVWPVKYFLRSERDDQFMAASSGDYVAYRERVTWKYIPGLL